MKNTIWTGRIDGHEKTHQRIHQIIQCTSDYNQIKNNDFVIHGFAVDEGVDRNKGRIGAKESPNVIRKNMANFPIHKKNINILDFGNIECENKELEIAQENLSNCVLKTLNNKGKSIVIGGGHEVTYAHYSGIRKFAQDKNIGIINIDAHFDNRIPEKEIGASSGTGFWQIAQEKHWNSLHLGIQKNSNTAALFNTANEYGMHYILADQMHLENEMMIIKKIDELFMKSDVVYLTICMDVFNASIAPGVSAPSYNGLFADHFFMKIYNHILASDKLIAMDIAEVNTHYDLQNRTARLAASLINEWFLVEKTKA